MDESCFIANSAGVVSGYDFGVLFGFLFEFAYADRMCADYYYLYAFGSF